MVVSRALSVTLLCLFGLGSSAQRDAIKTIFENIDKGYNKDVMPATPRNEPVAVGITVRLTKIYTAP